jgi:hypothetical protein
MPSMLFKLVAEGTMNVLGLVTEWKGGKHTGITGSLSQFKQRARKGLEEDRAQSRQRRDGQQPVPMLDRGLDREYLAVMLIRA